jgi:predicted metal-dependent enzyme (double-stranded beta helix superfamily)
MCDLNHHQHPNRYGFLLDVPEVRAVIDQARAVIAAFPTDPERAEALRPAFHTMLRTDGWLPEEYARPDETGAMGGGIGQYALYRAEDGSLCLFSLVVPVGAETPVHDHLAWGIVGLYRGTQDETVYRRLDDGADPSKAVLEVAKRQHLTRGGCYTLVPPVDDIHFVKTTSDVPSTSIHLLANDTACVWRHRFEPASGIVTPFRSGYANAPCPPEGD